MSEGVSFQFQDQTITRGVYAVLESSEYEALPVGATYASDMFRALNKQAHELNADGSIKKRRFWLTDVEAFHRPICVVGDIGLAGVRHSKLRYLHVESRDKWAELFSKWVNAAHEEDHMEDDEEEDAMLESSDEEEEEGLADEDDEYADRKDMGRI